MIIFVAVTSKYQIGFIYTNQSQDNYTAIIINRVLKQAPGVKPEKVHIATDIEHIVP